MLLVASLRALCPQPVSNRMHHHVQACQLPIRPFQLQCIACIQ
jgi:hypothetical protein